MEVDPTTKQFGVRPLVAKSRRIRSLMRTHSSDSSGANNDKLSTIPTLAELMGARSEGDSVIGNNHGSYSESLKSGGGSGRVFKFRRSLNQKGQHNGTGTFKGRDGSGGITGSMY